MVTQVTTTTTTTRANWVACWILVNRVEVGLERFTGSTLIGTRRGRGVIVGGGVAFTDTQIIVEFMWLHSPPLVVVIIDPPC